MRKFLPIAFILCPLLLASCDDRPSENRASSFAERDKRESKGAFSESRQIQLTNQTALRLDVEYNGGHLTIERDEAGLLADIKLEFDREENRPDIDFDSSSSSPTLRIRSPRQHEHSVSFDQLRDNGWRIKLSPKIPIDFHINGGVGASKLSFDGEWKNDARVDMNLGVGKNTILLARHIGAKVQPAGSFLSPIRLRGFDKRGSVRYSENYDQAAGHLDFDIKMGVGHTEIDWLDK